MGVLAQSPPFAGAIGYIPPVEAEANYYRQLSEQAIPAWLTTPGLRETRGGSLLVVFNGLAAATLNQIQDIHHVKPVAA